MLLMNGNTDSQQCQKLIKSFLPFCLIICTHFTGCKSESTTTTDKPPQKNISEIINCTASNEPPKRQIKQLNVKNANSDQKTTPIASAILTKTETHEESCQDSEYQSKLTAGSDRIVPTLTQEQAFTSADNFVTSDEANFTAQQPPPEKTVNLPVPDKPDNNEFLPPPVTRISNPDELISVNFDRVDIRVMLKTIGDITGINFVVDETITGPVTVISPTKIRLGDIYDFLESILEVHGYAAVPTADLVKIVPIAEAMKGNLQVRRGSDPSKIPTSDSIVTQIMTLRYADATDVSQIIRPFLSASSHLATYPRTNSIVVTDTSSNIHHVATIIQQLDVAGSAEQVTVMELKYASAKVLSEQITRIMGKSKAASSPSGPSRNIPQIETAMKILPDVRTNSLIVVANAQDTVTVKSLVKQLDVQRPSRASNVHVVYLKNAPAKEIAESLTAVLSNLKIAGALEATQEVQVSADVGTNALIITASTQDYEVIADIVEKLDIVREQVLVEMLIVEVSQDTLTEIGIDWATMDQAVAGSVRFFGATNFGPRVDFASGDLEGLAIGAWKMNNSNVSIGPILHALEKKSGVNILSTPHILTSNHQKAKIIVGENRPFVMESRITETDPAFPTVIKTFEYRDVGITLELTPHISQGGQVRLEIKSEFTKLIETVTTPSSDTPTTAKRQAETVVSMNSGSTIIIGGLIRDDKVTTYKTIPLLGDIPVVGNLFKFQRDQLQKTNLLIFIRPYILNNQEDLEQITREKKEQMKPVLEGLQQKNEQQ